MTSVLTGANFIKMEKAPNYTFVHMPSNENISKLGEVRGFKDYDDEDYYYEYEYDPNASNIPMEQLVPVSMTYGLTMVLGLLGNILVIISVAKFKKMQNVTNMFLLSLASADLLLVLICVPVKVRTLMFNCLV